MQWPVAEEAGEASSVAHTTEADLVSKFLEIRWEILNLVHEKDEATREVSWLKLQVDALQTTLSASQEETNAARARPVEADARVAGKISFFEESLILYSQLYSDSFLRY